MHTFTINRNSTSFRYLSRWNSSYKWLSLSGDLNNCSVARDFCTYYKHVAKQMLFHFFIGLFIPANVWVYSNLLLFGGLPTVVNGFNLLWMVPFLFMTLGTTAFVLMLIVYGVFAAIRDWIIKPIISLLPERKRKNHNERPGFLKTWYSGVKGNYCATIQYDDTILRHSTSDEE